MKARPISMANWMALAAPGLRAMPSTALAIALPCARPHRLDAIAIEKPALIGTQWPCTVLLPGVCANSPVLANIRIASTNSVFFVIRFSLDESLSGGGSRTPYGRAHTAERHKAGINVRALPRRRHTPWRAA